MSSEVQERFVSKADLIKWLRRFTGADKPAATGIIERALAGIPEGANCAQFLPAR